MQIRGNRQYSCTLKFKEQSILERNPHQVSDIEMLCICKQWILYFWMYVVAEYLK